jgi:hypothetical protein
MLQSIGIVKVAKINRVVVNSILNNGIPHHF